MLEPARLTIGPGADAVRGAVGPTAWAALEVLAARADTRHGVVEANVRLTAVALGLSKNAAHRAIRRLVDAGLVAPTQRRSTTGRYLPGEYRLTISPDVLTVASITEPVLPEPRASALRRRRADRSGQLDLLLDAG